MLYKLYYINKLPVYNYQGIILDKTMCNTNNEYKSNRDYYKHKYPLRQNRQLMTGGYKKIYEINKYNFTKLKYIL